jgi:hypothetical protein
MCDGALYSVVSVLLTTDKAKELWVNIGKINSSSVVKNSLKFSKDQFEATQLGRMGKEIAKKSVYSLIKPAEL